VAWKVGVDRGTPVGCVGIHVHGFMFVALFLVGGGGGGGLGGSLGKPSRRSKGLVVCRSF
jgi:hypothetical protein